MPHNSNGRHRRGGILALLASGSLLLASCAPVDQASADQAPVDRPDCDDWNTTEFFDQATAADVARCLSQGADPNARNKHGSNPLHMAASGWPDWLWERAPNYRDLTPSEQVAITLNSDLGREERLRMKRAWVSARKLEARRGANTGSPMTWGCSPTRTAERSSTTLT